VAPRPGGTLAAYLPLVAPSAGRVGVGGFGVLVVGSPIRLAATADKIVAISQITSRIHNSTARLFLLISCNSSVNESAVSVRRLPVRAGRAERGLPVKPGNVGADCDSGKSLCRLFGDLSPELGKGMSGTHAKKHTAALIPTVTTWCNVPNIHSSLSLCREVLFIQRQHHGVSLCSLVSGAANSVAAAVDQRIHCGSSLYKFQP